jgi:DNA polymerase III delta prime subunit
MAKQKKRHIIGDKEGKLPISKELSPEAKKMIENFNQGNFKKSRYLAKKQLKLKSAAKQDEKAAKDILARTGNDLVILYLSLTLFLLLVFIFFWAIIN